MKRSLQNLVRAVFVVLLFVPGPMFISTQPALANPSVQTVAAQPAVEVPEPSAEDEEDPWTARFLAPAVVVIAVAAVGAAASYYAVRVRGRYRVVE